MFIAYLSTTNTLFFFKFFEKKEIRSFFLAKCYMLLRTAIVASYAVNGLNKPMHVAGDVSSAAASAGGRDVTGRALGMGVGVCGHGSRTGVA